MPETNPETTIQLCIIIINAVYKTHIRIKLIRNITVIYNRFKRFCCILPAGIDILV